MQKIYDYLKKGGIEFEAVTLGSDYFFGLSIAVDAAAVRIPCTNTGKVELRRIKSYCEKRGYSVTHCGACYPYSGGAYDLYHICRASDRASVDLYKVYEAMSAETCCGLIHARHLNGGECDKAFNDMLAGIMAHYEQALRQAIEEIAA